MREIKFKGKQLRDISTILTMHSSSKGTWRFGSYVCAPKFLHEEVAHVIRNIKGDPYICDGDTICQYTGKKDKNEVDIYEGDITNKGTVVWDYGLSCWNIKDFYNSKYDYPNMAFSEKLEEIEVIGNIHDKVIEEEKAEK